MGPCGPTEMSTTGSCAVWLVRVFSLLSNDTRIELPGLGTRAMPLFAMPLFAVPFNQACTVEVRSNERYPIVDTGTALKIFVPSCGALL